MLKRVLKTLGALFGGVGVTVLTQFLLPPAFLHAYGVARYGEWLVLSGTLSYLAQLNFGITTYASNELTMLHKRGEREQYRALQGSTLLMLLVLSAVGTLISASVFLMPLARLLHLTSMDAHEATWTAFFLGMQTMVTLLAGYYNNLFMVVEQTHRGLNWLNARRLVVVVAALPPICLHASFTTIALAQFVVVTVVALATAVDLKRHMKHLPLGLAGANWKTARAALTPSGMFALLFAQQFLLFQVPLIVLQWILGPESVVVFSISRTVLSTARMLLQILTWAVGPEITFAFAERDKARMLKVFHYSEKLVYSLIPIANMGVLLASPILLKLWLHKPQLFDLKTYALMALISGAISMREHKQYFQFATNQHKRMALIVFFGNLAMNAVSIPITRMWGVQGFLYVWLVSEVAQMGLIYHENKKLFEDDASINLVPVFKLCGILFASTLLSVVLLQWAVPRSLLAVAAAMIAGMLVVTAESYFAFGLKDLWLMVRKKLRHAVPQTEQLQA